MTYQLDASFKKKSLKSSVFSFVRLFPSLSCWGKKNFFESYSFAFKCFKSLKPFQTRRASKLRFLKATLSLPTYSDKRADLRLNPLHCGTHASLTTSVCHHSISITFPNKKTLAASFPDSRLLPLGRKLPKLEELFSSVWKLFLNRVSYLSKSQKLMTAVPQRVALFFTRC